MKCKKFLSIIVGVMLAAGVSGQTIPAYVNDAIVTSPVQVDALNFINNNLFSFSILGLQPYQTANTINYTNRGLMSCNLGYRFDTFSTATGLHRPASNWVNQTTGTINCGAVTDITFSNAFLGSKLLVTATNIINRGTVNIGPDGIASFKGRSVDLSRGMVAEQGPDVGGGALGIFPGYWGLRTVEDWNPAANLGFAAFTPLHWITNRYYLTLQTAIGGLVSTPYSSDVFTGPSNRVVQAVFIANLNSSFSNNVYFVPGGGPVTVEWTWVQTNFLTDVVTTNYLYLQDTFGSRTNFQLRTIAGGAAPSTGPGPAFIPTNYTFFTGSQLLFGGTPANPGLPPGGFNNSLITNQYTAYEAIFTASSAILGEIKGQTFTNLPGRVEIDAERHLDLNRARLGAINFLSVKATNHFAGSDRARIGSPYSSMDLRTTNGLLVVTNLMLPSVPRLDGPMDLWSARWTNVDAFNVTNRYHVLIVNSFLSTSVATQFTDLKLRSTNVVIHDIFNVVSNFFTEAENLTIATNDLSADNASGQINLLNNQIVWPSSVPRLRNLTNDGVISTLNAVYFGSAEKPYETFINRGSVSDQASLIWARHFENHGTFFCGNGSFALEQSLTANLSDGAIFAAAGDVAIRSGSLTLSNVAMTIGRSLTLAGTNLLTDLGVTNGNSWSVSDGVNLLVKPAVGDLLGTTILSTAPLFAEVNNLWAGLDAGCSRNGFANNAAVGRLILDGASGSQHTFTGAGLGNAIYVDYLEFRNFITNRNVNGNYIGVQIDPNMKIYFAQAVVNGVSVASKLDGQNEGRFCWVSDYAGFYSSTNLIYPDGTTNSLNAALVANGDLDSDCDNLANPSDNTPVFLVTTPSLPDATNSAPYTAQLLAFGGPPSATITWSLAPGSAALPAGLNLSTGGLISGTPSLSGTNTFTVRAMMTSVSCTVTNDRQLTLIVRPAVLALALAFQQNLPAGASISWNTVPNGTNYVYYRASMQGGNWQLLTNFVSPLGGKVSLWDPVGTNQTRYYRVRVSTP